MKKIDLGVVVTTLIIVTISCSLAFFAARIVGNPKDINLVAKNVAITFTDTSSIADETISPGWNNVKSFTITNNSKEDFNYNILLKGLVNTFESINTLQYKITSDTGYNMDNYLNIVKTENSKDVVLAYDVVIPKGSKQTYQVEFKYISIDEDQSSDMGKRLGGTLAIEESTGKPKIYDKLLSDNPTIKTRTDFSTTFTETNVNTLYKAKESIAGSTPKDVYYFAGNAQNNWVKFGTWQEDKTVVLGTVKYSGGVYTPSAKEFSSIDECNSYTSSNNNNGAWTTVNCKKVKIASKGDPMYWRIIRTNEDGSVRLLYSGTSPDTITGYIGTSNFNNIDKGDPLYLGYMYGTSGSLENNRTNENSNLIKTYIDLWYEKNLYVMTKYLSRDAVYCNDRNVATMGDLNSYKIGDWMDFSVWDRNHYAYAPSYNCINKKDAFSVRNNEAKLTYPVALMTADEAFFAGGVFTKNSSNVWYFGNSKNESIKGELASWLMTPADGAPSCSGNIMGIGANGRIGYPDASNINHLAVKPVISIKGDLTYKSGDGSAEHPYELEDFTSLTDKVLSDNPTVETRTDFSTVYTDTNTGKIFKSTETNTPVYYFAGNAQNNWVKFGTWKEDTSIIVGKTSDKKEYNLFSSISECNADSTYSTDCEKIILGTKGEDMYWRIIRTNSDGSVRLLYAGTSPSSINAYIGLSKYTENTSGYLYAGYMYGTSGSIKNNRTNENSSTIKTYVDSWYKSNLTSYTKYLSKSAIYCSDRDLANTNLYGGDNVYSDTYGFGFAARDRLSTDFTPNYNCNNTKDSFSVNNTEAKLTYPVALMTADEIAFAGGKCHTETKSYFSQNSLDTNSTNYIRWWTMTPTHQTKTIKVKVYDVISISTYGNNVLNDDNDSDYLYAVRPVISIKENAIYKSGDGSSSNPYEIVTE